LRIARGTGLAIWQGVRLGAREIYPSKMKAKRVDDPILKVVDLKTYFFTEDGVVRAVDGVEIEVNKGELFGLVGESGCGKSVTALSIMRLVENPGMLVDGEIYFHGLPIHTLSEDEMLDMRGKGMSMVFQHPRSSLNPVFRVGDQVAEVLQIHSSVEKGDAWQKAVEMLERMGISDAQRISQTYPHELSGGQAQRVMIAIAMITQPDLLIADEPTSALDVTIQAQILDLIRDMQESMGTSIILITHDMGVIAEMAERVAVMFAGSIVEQAEVGELFETSLHPYTQVLMDSALQLGADRQEHVPEMVGSVGDRNEVQVGCRFAPRCSARLQYELSICVELEPELKPVNPDHAVRCWLYHDHADHRAPVDID
jgi:oligopeptide/dipeptide ABC transporter ATP-binding protein